MQECLHTDGNLLQRFSVPAGSARKLDTVCCKVEGCTGGGRRSRDVSCDCHVTS